MRRRLLAGFFLFALALVVALEVPLGLSLARNDRTDADVGAQRDASSLAVLVCRGSDTVAAARAFSSSSTSSPVLTTPSSRSSRRACPRCGRKRRARGAARRPHEGDHQGRPRPGHTSGEEGSNDPDDDFLYVALPVARRRRAPAAHPRRHGSDVVLLVAESAAPLHARIRTTGSPWPCSGSAARRCHRPRDACSPVPHPSARGHRGSRRRGRRGPLCPSGRPSGAARPSSRLSARPSTRWPTAWRSSSTPSGRSSPTPPTSCALPSRRCACVSRTSRRLSRPTSEPISRPPSPKPTGSRGSSTDCSPSRGPREASRPTREPVDVDTRAARPCDAWSALAEERQVASLSCRDPPPLRSARLESPCLPGSPRADPRQPPRERARSDAARRRRVAQRGPRRRPHRDSRDRRRAGHESAERTRAFDRFWRREGAPHGGTGLGLAIVAQLARMSGGTAGSTPPRRGDRRRGATRGQPVTEAGERSSPLHRRGEADSSAQLYWGASAGARSSRGIR